MRGPLKDPRVSIDTSDASKVFGAYSIAMFMIVGSMVIRFDRVEFRHVVTAERRRKDLRRR
jgi:hypothetical protein